MRDVKFTEISEVSESWFKFLRMIFPLFEGKNREGTEWKFYPLMHNPMKYISKHYTELISLLLSMLQLISSAYVKKWKIREQWSEADAKGSWNENKDKEMRQLAATEK